MSEPRIIALDPAIWARGKPGGSLLGFRGDELQRQQCCIGVACTVLGVPDDVIKGEGCIEELPFADVPEAFTSFATIEQPDYPDDDDPNSITNDNLSTVYAINDDTDIADDAERVAKINAELERVRAPFRFSFAGTYGEAP